MMQSLKTLFFFGLVLILAFATSCSQEEGCTCQQSSNYDSSAEVDDGSCLGCTDPGADNYNSCASVNDGQCFTTVLGCTDPDATNYNPEANTNDFSCVFPVPGCTDPTAFNYDPDATVDDGSCEAVVTGCTDPTASNYNPDANTDDGTCSFVVSGCTDPNATNYDPSATSNDGSCMYDGYQLFSLSNPEVNDTTRVIQWVFQVLDLGGNGVEECSVQGASGDCLDGQVESEGGDFIVSEDGSEISSEASASFVPEDIPFSIKTILLLDYSFSLEEAGVVDDVKLAAQAFVDSKTDEQEIAIFTFDSGPTQLQDFTTDKATLTAAIDGISETGLQSTTNLWGSVVDMYEEIETSLYTTAEIRATSLVIFTDGRHTAGNLDNLLASARSGLGNRDAFIVALQTDEWENGGESDAITFLGGSDDNIISGDIDELSSVFERAQEQIISLSRSVYVLDYKTPIIFQSTVSLRIEIVGNSNTSSNSSITTSFTISDLEE